MKYGLTIALTISLVLGAAAVWGSCAVPHRPGEPFAAIADLPAP